MEDLVIVGSGGMGRLARQIAEDINRDVSTWNVLGFLDESAEKHRNEVAHLPVLGGLAWLEKRPDVRVIVAIGNTRVRHRIVCYLQSSGYSFATLVHPRAWVGDRTVVGPGSIVYPDVLIDPDVWIGRHAILNKACTVGHDAVIGDCVTIAPGVNLAGTIEIGMGCDMGINSATLQNLSIGAWTVVGGGAVVTKNLPCNVTAVGVPAKVIERR